MSPLHKWGGDKDHKYINFSKKKGSESPLHKWGRDKDHKVHTLEGELKAHCITVGHQIKKNHKIYKLR